MIDLPQDIKDGLDKLAKGQVKVFNENHELVQGFIDLVGKSRLPPSEEAAWVVSNYYAKKVVDDPEYREELSQNTIANLWFTQFTNPRKEDI